MSLRKSHIEFSKVLQENIINVFFLQPLDHSVQCVRQRKACRAGPPPGKVTNVWLLLIALVNCSSSKSEK